jgi:hypothetical protein
LFMQEAQPNRNHEVLAALAKIGARLFTTNFDTLIERCDPTINVGHLHGSVGNPEELRTTIQAVTRPLADSLRVSLLDALERCHLLIIIGYSGGDTFDVTPVLEKASRLSGLRLIWLQHWQQNQEVRIDRGARKVTAHWPEGAADLLPCDSDRLFDTLGNAIDCHPKTTSDLRFEKGWWRSTFVESLNKMLPKDRNIAALAILESLHSSRFFGHYSKRMDEGSLTAKQRLVFQRAMARRECARGQYRSCKAVMRRAVWWTAARFLVNLARGHQEGIGLSDVSDQLLLYSMHMRVAGQHSLIEYCRSLVPLILASITCRFASEASIDWHDRKKFEISTDWVQFYLIFPNHWLKRLGANLRRELLESTSWEAEHRARLLIADPAMRGTATAMDLNYDIESFGGLVNEARSNVRKDLPSGTSTFGTKAKIQAIHSCYRILGDIPGYFKTELVWAEFLSAIDTPAASSHLRKADWLLRQIRWPLLTRRYWQKEVFRIGKLIGQPRPN